MISFINPWIFRQNQSNYSMLSYLYLQISFLALHYLLVKACWDDFSEKYVSCQKRIFSFKTALKHTLLGSFPLKFSLHVYIFMSLFVQKYPHVTCMRVLLVTPRVPLAHLTTLPCAILERIQILPIHLIFTLLLSIF